MRERFRSIQLVRGCLRVAVFASLALGWLVSSSMAFAQKQEISTATIQHVEKFQGATTLLDKSGKPRMVRAAVHHWTILGEQRIPEFEERGLLLVQLLGGKVTTVIDGKEQKRSKGEFWVVPANAKMSIHATGETATLDVTVLNIP
jgi:quercetin dioxygenase-like cupin family protein